MELANMSRSDIGAASVALACVTAFSCYMIRVPDLPLAEAAKIISRAPEFNRYARLVKVEAVDHMKDSMDGVSYGQFTFLYLNSPSDAPPIKAQADFRYIEGKWYLNGFDYGCPKDCHFVDIFDGPDKTRDSSQ
jgi:hypothetical protein